MSLAIELIAECRLLSLNESSTRTFILQLIKLKAKNILFDYYFEDNRPELIIPIEKCSISCTLFLK